MMLSIVRQDEFSSTLNAEYALLCDLLKQLRKEAGLSQLELAQTLNKPQSYISKIESGERRLDVIELRELCQQCGIDLITFSTRFEELLGHSNAGESKFQ